MNNYYDCYADRPWFLKGDKGELGPIGKTGDSYEVTEAKAACENFQATTTLDKTKFWTITQGQPWVLIQNDNFQINEDGFYTITALFEYGRSPYVGNNPLAASTATGISISLYEDLNVEIKGTVQGIIIPGSISLSLTFFAQRNQSFSLRSLTDSSYLYLKGSYSLFKFNTLRNKCFCRYLTPYEYYPCPP